MFISNKPKANFENGEKAKKYLTLRVSYGSLFHVGVLPHFAPICPLKKNPDNILPLFLSAENRVVENRVYNVTACSVVCLIILRCCLVISVVLSFFFSVFFFFFFFAVSYIFLTYPLRLREQRESSLSHEIIITFSTELCDF